ncbi:hypothetical protein CIB93_36370 [Streptomyces sp. WZ.A104]|uniref:Uncharacterized protein n=1 Tax=Streptomyces durocortorensis TaxID=2811104 RepID=A0ABY9VS15_9ACTN|nr:MULTISPECIES: hypothetical protein [Streptomyces]PCG81259.1 hypothetical protein CIB93_36370 [Streptomyces sp. WZ.A104]WNF25949.1 hypothetical protein RI138_03540 [Streptomyces durocortorensis]
MSDEGDLEYLPEEFRTSARHNREAADGADSLSRRLANTTATSGEFGGTRAASYTAGLNQGTTDRTRRTRRAQEDRDVIGHGGATTADLGEDTDIRARTALQTPADAAVVRAVADGM